MKALSQAIRQARLDSGTGQRELARQLNLSPSYVCDIEKGLRVPPPETIRRFAEGLGVEVGPWLWIWCWHQIGEDLAQVLVRYVRYGDGVAVSPPAVPEAVSGGRGDLEGAS